MLIGLSSETLPAFAGPPDQFRSTAQFRSADLVSSKMIEAGVSIPVARWRSKLGLDAITKGFPHHTIILQNAGEDVRRVDNREYASRRSSAGSLLILPAGMEAAWRSENISDRTHYYVHPDLVRQVALEILGHDCAIREDGIFIFDTEFADLLRRYSFILESPSVSRFEQDLTSLEIASRLVRSYSSRSSEPLSTEVPNRTRLAQFVENNLAGNLTAKAVSSALKMSDHELDRAARKQFGMPLRRYVIKRRLACAADLIKTGVPIAEAALETGFSSQSHLTASMSKVYGKTPGAFRAPGF